MQIKVYMGSNQLSGHFQPAVVQWLRVIELFQRGFDRINLDFFLFWLLSIAGTNHLPC